jgi:hypothetical protein
MMTSPDIDIVDKLRFWQSRAKRHAYGSAPVDYVTLRQAADEIVLLRGKRQTDGDNNEDARQQRRHIEAARDLLKPSPVRLHHVPRWLIQRIRKHIGTVPMCHSGFDVVHQAACDTGSDSWLDHFGSTTINGRPAFVSEPYLGSRGIVDAMRFAERLMLEFDFSPNSWWYPGQTTRLIFQEPAENLVSDIMSDQEAP